MKFIRFNDFIVPASTIEWMRIETEVPEYAHFEILLRTFNGEEFSEQFYHNKIQESKDKAAIAINKRFNKILETLNG